MNKLKFSWFILTVSLLAIFCLTTCDSPMGMGLPIDWEAPVLTLDKTDSEGKTINYNPLYVRSGTVISGTATDNIGVDRITITDTATGQNLAPVIRVGDRFMINFTFSPELNGKTFVAQISAFDKMGNCDEGSIAIVTLIIDIKEPKITLLEIKRTDTRSVAFENLDNIQAQAQELQALRALETTDPLGEVKDNLYKYQNGWFYIKGQIAEEETKIETLSINFYDYTSPNVPLIDEQDIDSGSTYYFPQWTIKEEDLINAGVDKLNNPNYKTDYYSGNKRYYYRVVIKGTDKAGNELQKQVGYICLWAESDKPKGVIDPAIGAIVSKGTPLPVDLYDDDSLLKAWIGLLTQDQWDGKKPIASGTNINGATDAAKIEWLKTRLLANGQVLNWNYDKHNKSEPITELMGTGSGKIDEKTVYIATGKEDADYGDYVLFVIAIDKKLPPHVTSPADTTAWTNKEVWNGKIKKVQLIDENVPLIVFDTRATLTGTGTELPLPTNPCPEENTFPAKLYAKGSDPEPKYFDITGYTLRENSSTLNSVTVFRMAWIPYKIQDGSDSYITAVQDALKNGGTDMPAGVQYWEFTPGTGPGKLEDKGKDLTITAGTYKRQTFTKTFNVMGDTKDDLKSDYYNFRFNPNNPNATITTDTPLENESKLFIFYAKDNMSHEVFRQLRILGYKDKPKLQIWDITNRTSNMPTGYPDPTNSATMYPATAFYTALNNYNKQTDVIAALQNAYLGLGGITGSANEAGPFQMYPRGAIVKYWVIAEQAEKVSIRSIKMYDITNGDQVLVGSDYTANKTYSFAESYPDITQRTFLFEATDKLDNVVSIQRTIAVTNAARLEKISTTSQNGTYGVGKNITLTANFSGQIYIDNNVKPILNVRYQVVDTADKFNTAKYIYKYDTIECNTTLPLADTPSLSLSFNFTVPANSIGKLETAYDGGAAYGTTDNQRLPINKNGASIFDKARTDDAFIPGYSTKSATMPNWTTTTNTLQGSKTINLDGVAPTITGTAWGGKKEYSGNNYYFKTGETVQVTITADKAIRASGASTLQYQIRDLNGTLHPSPSTYYSPANTNTNGNTEFFKYLKPGGTDGKSLVYNLSVNAINCPSDGEIVNVSEYKGSGSGRIEDNAENAIVVPNAFSNLIPTGTRIYIKQTVPAAPTAAAVQLGGVNLDVAKQYYNAPVSLTIAASTSRGPDSITWEDNTQYTITNAFNDYNGAVSIGSNGTYTLQARYKDRAGNEGPSIQKIIELNLKFPKLISVNATQANGYYKKDANLEFNLNFAENVAITNASNVTITLENRSASNGADNKIVLNANANTSYTANKATNGADATNNIYTAAAGGSPGATGAYVPIAVNGNLYTAYVVNGATNTRTFRIYPAGTTTGGAATGGASLDLGNITFTVTSLASTVKFSWNGITGKEMREGLYISVMSLTGLSDKFGNAGPTGIKGSYDTANGAFSNTADTIANDCVKDCKNLTAGLKVDSILPSVTAWDPEVNANATTSASNALIKTITLKFREPVMKGSGIITIRPRGNYSIPPVFDDTGYYLGYASAAGAESGDGSGPVPTKYTTAGTNRTYISSFYDIYNNSALNATDRGYLLKGSSMSKHDTSPVTGQSVGPYKKMTQGLVQGPGYTGNYSGSGIDGPDLVITPQIPIAMIPDTATKWVLDYQYVINDTTANSAVSRIRATLTKAKWRWQEIDVVSVDISNDDTTKTGTVTIKLNEPLLKGLEWDVIYDQGTFTDFAGNPVAASAAGDYYFTTPGVQAPVIRVNRRSYDGRTSASRVAVGDYQDAGTTTGWDLETMAVTDNNGWGISSFNSVHYRVESETPNAAVTAKVFQGAIGTGAARGAWTGTVRAANDNVALATGGTNRDWTLDDNNYQTIGSWLLPNIIRRTTNGGTKQTYYVITKSGGREQRDSTATLRMYRSYNKDLTKDALDAVNSPDVSLSSGQGVINYVNGSNADPYKASKSYVIGTAKKTSLPTPVKGYEGVYRTVIMFNYENDRNASNYIAVEGSNIKNGMPSIAGFPVRDADETDCRYLKVFYADQSGNNRQRYYWVSTEIVCEWYFLSWGGGSATPSKGNGTHQSCGEVNNYQTVGYGDLTYGFNITRF